MALWIRMADLWQERYFFSSGGQTQRSNGVALYTLWNGLWAIFSKNQVVWNVEVTNVRTNQWHHVIVTWDSIHARFYINGCFIKRSSGRSNPTNDNSLYNNIFLGRENAFGTIGFGRGFLDEIYILEYSLDDNDALSFYLASF